MISPVAWRAASILYGLVAFVMLTSSALLDGAFFRSARKDEEKELAIAQEKFWDLSKSPLSLTHRFFTLKNGTKLHYVENAARNNPKNVTIFIHGFPDSWILWQRLLTSSRLAQSSVLIGVDLPGYGGSDGIPSYGPEGVLETLAEFILGIRQKYGQPGGKAFVVAHDWGAIASVRFAAEAPQLADRFIVTSAVIPQHLYSTSQSHFASSKQMLHTWVKHPFSLRLLKSAYQTLSPVLGQIGKSYYIFVFNLPKPLANLSGSMGQRWFFQVLVRVAHGKFKNGRLGKMEGIEAAEPMANCSGPGARQIGTTTSQDGYSESVRRRIGDLGWSEKIRLYREGLFTGPWVKSLETIVRLSELDANDRRSSSGAGIFDNGPEGALQAPVTFVFGKQDPAFDARLALEGISDYLSKQSQVVLLENGGHWLPNEKRSAQILEEVVAWAENDTEGSLKERLESFPDAKVTVDK